MYVKHTMPFMTHKNEGKNKRYRIVVTHLFLKDRSYFMIE